MLKLYANKDLLTEENRKSVFPLLFDLYFVESKKLKNYFQVVNTIEESDIVVIALEYGFMLKKFKRQLKLTSDKAKKFKKPIWIYSGGDYGISIEDHDIYNFRLGGFKSKLNNNTIIIPSFISDPYELYIENEFEPMRKEKVPGMGFVGHASQGLIKLIKEIINYLIINFKRFIKLEYADYQSFYPSSVKRSKYLRFLQKSKQLKCDFVFRNKYRAGVKYEEDKADSTKEFYKNIFNNAYTFCIRGNGNFSVRFYETLAMGRIPILLNTDCLLPLNSVIKWDEHCVIIDEANYKLIEQKVLEFHARFSEKEFVDLQKINRDLWKNNLTRHTFFPIIHDIFINKIHSK